MIEPGTVESDWAPGAVPAGDVVGPSELDGSDETGAVDDDGEVAPEFVAIFGAPDVRLLGHESIHHRRRGFAVAAGGGDTLDRRQRGASDDVLVTLLAHPANAAEQAVHGHSLRAVRRLRVDVDARRSERRDLVFDASLRTVLWFRRPARLRLYGSASRNVTILTLAPAQARRRPSRWFVRAGTRAMERIVERLAADVEPLRWQPPNELPSAAEEPAVGQDQAVPNRSR